MHSHKGGTGREFVCVIGWDGDIDEMKAAAVTAPPSERARSNCLREGCRESFVWRRRLVVVVDVEHGQLVGMFGRPRQYHVRATNRDLVNGVSDSCADGLGCGRVADLDAHSLRVHFNDPPQCQDEGAAWCRLRLPSDELGKELDEYCIGQRLGHPRQAIDVGQQLRPRPRAGQVDAVDEQLRAVGVGRADLKLDLALLSFWKGFEAHDQCRAGARDGFRERHVANLSGINLLVAKELSEKNHDLRRFWGLAQTGCCVQVEEERTQPLQDLTP